MKQILNDTENILSKEIKLWNIFTLADECWGVVGENNKGAVEMGVQKE